VPLLCAYFVISAMGCEYLTFNK